MKVVILAGGLGTRISEESHLKPKPMITIGDKPILWHIMKYYTAYGLSEFVICCGYKADIIKEYFANYYLHMSDVTFDFSDRNKMVIHENIAEPWKVTLVNTGLDSQTGSRIKQIQPYVDGELFMLTYGDGVSDVNLNNLIESHEKSDCIVTMTGVCPRGRFGVLEVNDADNKVLKFREKATANGDWINGGFMIMRPEVFNYLSVEPWCVLERTPLETLAAEHKLGVYKHHGFWECMDTRRDMAHLEQLWLSGKAPWKIW